MPRRHFFCCLEDGKWMPFASEYLEDRAAQALVEMLNDSFAEEGIAVRGVAAIDLSFDDSDRDLFAKYDLEADYDEMKRRELAESTPEARAESRRMTRESVSWTLLTERFERGQDEDLPSDCPQRFRAWTEFAGALAYVRDLECEGLVSPDDVETQPRSIPEPRQIETPPQETIDDPISEPRNRYGVDWPFEEGPPDGSKYRFGPITGPITTIANAVSTNVRTFKDWNGKSVWIRVLHSRKYEVYFDSERMYRLAAAVLPPL
jgi:hypothetical protein